MTGETAPAPAPAAPRARAGFWPALVAVLIVAVLALYAVAFTVPAGMAAVVKHFGNPLDRVINVDGGEAGLHFKAPAPIQTVQLIDMRPRLLTLRDIELATADPFTVHLITTVEWRVTDPLRFVLSYPSERLAEEAITTSLLAVRTALAQSIKLGFLVSTEPAQPGQYAEFERRFLASARGSIDPNSGVEVTNLRLGGIAVPPSASSAIMGHMSAQRRALARRYQQDGQNEVRRIRAEAESQVSILMADANARATSIRAEGDAAAAEALQAFGQDPDATALVTLFRKIEAANRAIKENSLLIVSGDNPPFDILAPDTGRP